MTAVKNLILVKTVDVSCLATYKNSVVENRISNQKVAESRFDYQTGNASFRFWEKHFTYIFHWGDFAAMISLDERLENRIQKMYSIGVVRQILRARFITINEE